MIKVMLRGESYAARVWRKTRNGVGVEVGLAWIALLVFTAVFAPF